MFLRRTWLKAATGMPLFAAGMAPAAAIPGQPMAGQDGPEAVVVDVRHDFGAIWAGALPHARLLPLQEDPTTLWRLHLLPRWREAGGHGVVAGVTPLPVLFCLDQLAREHRYRAVAVLPVAVGGLAHPRSAACPMPESCSTAWESRLRVLLQRALARGPHTLPGEPLVAWVIAPSRSA